mmetsp:Transcript_3218/g.6994  ORF Transcript_3218/g.6994 Transcript_3218/m.6994 type:complete len:267 (+) Transcript_3218:316-1116(+)
MSSDRHTYALQCGFGILIACCVIFYHPAQRGLGPVGTSLLRAFCPSGHDSIICNKVRAHSLVALLVQLVHLVQYPLGMSRSFFITALGPGIDHCCSCNCIGPEAHVPVLCLVPNPLGLPLPWEAFQHSTVHHLSPDPTLRPTRPGPGLAGAGVAEHVGGRQALLRSVLQIPQELLGALGRESALPAGRPGVNDGGVGHHGRTEGGVAAEVAVQHAIEDVDGAAGGAAGAGLGPCGNDGGVAVGIGAGGRAKMTPGNEVGGGGGRWA